MYKIYINDTPLCLTAALSDDLPAEAAKSSLLLRYPGKKKFLLNIIDQLEKTTRFHHVVLCDGNVGRLWNDFVSLFQFIEAAGGVVFNDKKEVLLIFRRGYWDLPKGKLDPGEMPAQAALREVEEETGLNQLQIIRALTETYHTYEQNNRRILKKTYWYSMKTTSTELKLQHEEDIESARWVDVRQFLANPGKVYGNIVDVLKNSIEFPFLSA